MFKRKKSVITVTFDPYHNFPSVKAKNCSDDQILDAALLMKGDIVAKRSKMQSAAPCRRRKKKENKIHKFFRILGVLLFHKKTVPSVEERRRRTSPHSDRPFLLPASV